MDQGKPFCNGAAVYKQLNNQQQARNAVISTHMQPYKISTHLCSHEQWEVNKEAPEI